MFQDVQDHLQWRADMLLAGRFEDMRQEYLFPMPVYLQDSMIAVQDPEEAINQAARLRKILHARHIDRLTITVKMIEVPSGGRFRVWADWDAVSSVTQRSWRRKLIYYMRGTQHGYQSEMLHYQRVPLRSSCGGMELRQQHA